MPPGIIIPALSCEKTSSPRFREAAFGSGVLRSLLALGSLLFVFASGARGSETARGVVFHDVTEDGTFDADDVPLAGVAISNGREIVLTGEEGRYELPVEADTTVFLIKPRGWRTPVNQHQIPQFFYTHSPAGADGDRFPGLDPTGPLPPSIDFALYPQEEPDELDVLIFGDTQPRNLEEIYYLGHDSLHELGEVNAAFGVTLGDVVFDNLAIAEDLNAAVATVGIPWRHIIGNHDADRRAPATAGIEGAYQRVYGPRYYAFSQGPAHFIAVDNIRWQENEQGERIYRTGLGGDQLTFIRRELERLGDDQLVVLMAHIPWVGSTPWADEGERSEFFALLAQHPKAISLVSHAHMHYHEFLGEKHGWPEHAPHHMIVVGAVCGSWWGGAQDEYGIPHSMMRCGTPTGYGFLSIDGADWKFRYRAARRPASFQMHIEAPDSVPFDAGKTEVLANIFNALPDAEVRMRIGPEGEWQSMERVLRPDPVYGAVRAREDKNAGRAPAGRLPDSRHLWQAFLPEGLEPGFHAIDVRAEDKWAVYEGRRLIRVER